MEEVCLNSEPIFDEGDVFDIEGNGSMLEHDQDTGERQTIKNKPTPTIGLEFDSFDEAYNFFNIYAMEQGFGIRVSNSWFRSKKKERYRARLSCSCAGFKKKSEAHHPRPETRTGCPTMVVIRLLDSRRWRIVELELEHNHPLSPQSKRFFKSHKKMILAAKNAQEPQQPVMEVHTIKLYRPNVMDANYNGYSNLYEGECTSAVDHSKHLKLKDGDASALYNYFCRMKLTNPNFFYLMDLDDEGRLKNVFWADARSRAAYNYFFDVVAIDTTGLANKYEIPLISFVGVNHHGQSILLGCGFVGHESVEYFGWIFRAWLTCMLGRPPQVIVTDQSKPLQTAVYEVFPGSHHCYCMWYIMQRVPERLGGRNGYEEIRKQLNGAVYNSLKIAEFESSWGSMMKRHGLGENRWLQSLYEDRKMWVPVYLKDTFFAGIIPIQENEGLNSFFGGYVHKHTSFKEFLDRYDLALHRNHLKEAMADLESRTPCFELRTRYNFEVQLSKVYTKDIFRKFQSEVEEIFSCFNTKQVNVNGSIVTYIVRERVVAGGNMKEVRSYEVLFETNLMDIRCICSLFNYKGYLCRHAMTVLNYNGVEEIPSRYILPRWCKNFKRQYSPVRDFDYLDVNTPIHRHNHLYRCALQVVEEGAQSQEHYKVALQDLDNLLNDIDSVDNTF